MAADIIFVVAKKLSIYKYLVSNLSTPYNDIEWMETELWRVHELLEEDPGLEMNRKELRKWVRDLIHAAQNIEDIVDYFGFSRERRQQRMGCMGSAFLAVKVKVARYKIVAEVNRVKEKMSQICESMPNKQVFGFDKDFDALVKLLVEGNEPHPLYMFIVGPCGAGKTTLVKEVYDSDAVKEQFPSRFWFCGQNYKFRESGFLKKMSKKVKGLSRVGQEVELISDALKDKRYLIVLDINLRDPGDISSKFISKFVSVVRKALPDERNGSRVVVTCNDKRDADLFGQEIEVHELGMLSSEEKWKLFLNTWDFDATTAGISLSSGMLEEIVRKQMHLPSEIVNLGYLLSKENRESSALSNIMLVHPHYYQVDGPERTLSKIASSFNLLDSPLKLCFLYCSLFPKGFEIPTRRLFELWLAEGWFYPDEEDAMMFYLAMEQFIGRVDSVELLIGRVYSYFEELSHLGMNQVEYSRIRLESPAWDFAAMKAMQYNLSHKIDNEGPPDSRSSSSNARGLALHSNGIYKSLFQISAFWCVFRSSL